MRQRGDARRRDRGAPARWCPGRRAGRGAARRSPIVADAVAAAAALPRPAGPRGGRAGPRRRARPRVRALGLARPFDRAAACTAGRGGRPHRSRPTTLAAAVDGSTGVADVAVATDAGRRRRSCGATARPTPRRSTRIGPPHKSTSPCRRRRLAAFLRRRRRRGRAVDPGRRDVAVRPRSPTATSTSTSPALGRPERRGGGRARCCGWWPTGAARSAPSTASARRSARWLRLDRSAGRARRHAGDQARPRPRRHPQPRRPPVRGVLTGPSRQGRRLRRTSAAGRLVDLAGARPWGARRGRSPPCGALKWARRSRTWRDQLVRGRASARRAATTKATGTSPHRSSGAPTTAASRTAGCVGQRLLDLGRRRCSRRRRR